MKRVLIHRQGVLSQSLLHVRLTLLRGNHPNVQRSTLNLQSISCKSVVCQLHLASSFVDTVGGNFRQEAASVARILFSLRACSEQLR